MTAQISTATASVHNLHTLAGVWVISDGAAGNERQAMALATAMHLAPDIVRLGLRAPWSWFAPRMTLGARMVLPASVRKRLDPPWPALAIGCGRDAALLTRLLRQCSGGRTFAVQILDPRIDPGNFDLVIAPRHDELTGANVIQTLGALNPVNESWLAQGLVEFSTLQQLPHPRTAVLIGGPRRGMAMDSAWFDGFLARVGALVARDGGSLMIASSRRTPPIWRARLHGVLRDGCAHLWNGPEDGVNPYQGYLAAADRIVVTPDSVNMLSEACATGKPVYTSLPDDARGRLRALHDELRTQGWLHELTDNMDFSTLQQPPPLRELAVVAGKVWHTIESTRPDVAVALGSV